MHIIDRTANSWQYCNKPSYTHKVKRRHIVCVDITWPAMNQSHCTTQKVWHLDQQQVCKMFPFPSVEVEFTIHEAKQRTSKVKLRFLPLEASRLLLRLVAQPLQLWSSVHKNDHWTICKRGRTPVTYVPSILTGLSYPYLSCKEKSTLSLESIDACRVCTLFRRCVL